MSFHFFKHLTKVAIAALCIATSSILSAASVENLARINRDGDSGLWIDEYITFKIPCTNFTGYFNPEQRWGDDFDLFYYHSYELTLQYHMTDTLKKHLCLDECNTLIDDFWLGIGYSVINSISRDYGRLKADCDEPCDRVLTPGNFHWLEQLRPDVELGLSLKWCDWLLTQRFRLEYNGVAHHAHYKRYGDFRYLAVLFFPWKFTCFEIQPFVFNEAFFRNDTFNGHHLNGDTGSYGLAGGLYENRFRVGVVGNIPLWCCEEILKTSIFYQLRSLRNNPHVSPNYKKTHQLGLAFSYAW